MLYCFSTDKDQPSTITSGRQQRSEGDFSSEQGCEGSVRDKVLRVGAGRQQIVDTGKSGARRDSAGTKRKVGRPALTPGWHATVKGGASQRQGRVDLNVFGQFRQETFVSSH